MEKQLVNYSIVNKPLCMKVWPDMGKALGISRSNAYKLAHSKQFPTIYVGDRMLVSVKGLEAWVDAQTAGGTTQE